MRPLARLAGFLKGVNGDSTQHQRNVLTVSILSLIVTGTLMILKVIEEIKYGKEGACSFAIRRRYLLNFMANQENP